MLSENFPQSCTQQCEPDYWRTQTRCIAVDLHVGCLWVFSDFWELVYLLLKFIRFHYFGVVFLRGDAFIGAVVFLRHGGDEMQTVGMHLQTGAGSVMMLPGVFSVVGVNGAGQVEWDMEGDRMSHSILRRNCISFVYFVTNSFKKQKKILFAENTLSIKRCQNSYLFFLGGTHLCFHSWCSGCPHCWSSKITSVLIKHFFFFLRSL